MTVPAAFTFLGIAGATGSTLGLGFNALPMVFSSMPAGQLFGFLFFFLLFLAAVTSSSPCSSLESLFSRNPWRSVATDPLPCWESLPQ